MDKVKKKRIKRYLTWGAMAAVVLLLTLMPLLAKNTAEAEGPQASVLTATVEQGSVSQVLHGGGTLQSDAVDVKIPEGVKITEFLVKNGDQVTAGTPVARVDKVSVMMAMTQVEDTLSLLREKIEDAREESVPDTIKATAGGRVKKIFAQSGEDVQEVMLRDGALALLSIDGRMAVKLEAKASVGTGETVDVTFPDGTVVSGRVESNLDGVVIVTVEDQGYAIGETVTVEGIGQGSLYVHNAWKATAYSGTVSQVSAKEETTLSSGATLMTLEDTEYTGQLEYRMGQHQKYEALAQRLMQMYESGTIDAPCDGVISGVDKDSTYLLSAQEAPGGASLLASNGTDGVRLMLLSNFTPTCTGEDPANEDCQAPEGQHLPGCPRYTCLRATQEGVCKAAVHEKDCIEVCNPSNCTATGAHKPGCITFCAKASDPAACPNPAGGNHYSDCIHACSGKGTDTDKCPGTKNHYLTCMESCISSDGTKECPATRTHKKTCLQRCSHADLEGVCDAQGKHYFDCVESCTRVAATCAASKHHADCELYGLTFTARAAKVDSVGTAELVVYWDASGTEYPVERTASGWAITGGKLDESLLVAGGTLAAANAGQFQKGDIVLAVTGYRGTEMAYSAVALYQSGQAEMPGTGLPGGFPGGISGMIGGFGGNGTQGKTAPETEDEGLYDLEGETLLTVMPQDTMTISITLDEQDIGKISVGMAATVKVEALRGRTYPAEVTKVGYTGSNNGGSSKYAVELTLEVDRDMLDGMSTTAEIILETREDIPVIPLAALDGDSVTTVVYTALDKETGKPANPVTVETGLSDGENVEIRSGLEIGDTVYYSYYDTLTLDTSA